MTGSAATHAVLIRRLAVISLAAALIPLVVMAVRAVVEGWVPLFDAGYFAARALDVGGPHHPYVGAWSMGSRSTGVWVNNFGPLQLDLLAPFVAISAYAGTAVGTAAINAASIVAVFFAARRLGGDRLALWSMLATLLLELNTGTLNLIEARQQLALIQPLWATLWVAAAVAAGHRWFAPLLVVTASLVVQTHFTYVFPTTAAVLCAVVGAVVIARRRLATLLAPLAAALAVALVCWWQPLFDWGWRSGNLGRVLSSAGTGDEPIDGVLGVRILGEAGFVPPYVWPGSMGDVLRSWSTPSFGLAVLTLVMWVIVLGVVGVVSPRHPLRPMAAVAMATIGGSVVAVVNIPPTEQFGVIAQNYYWAWPVALFAATVVIGAVATRGLVAARARFGRGPTLRTAPLAVTALCVIAALASLAPTNPLPETDDEWDVSRLAARPLLDQLANSLAERSIDGPVVLDLGTSPHVRYTMFAELHDAGVDFRFPPGSTSLARFGAERCDDGSAAWELILRGGPAPDSPGDVLASVDGLDRADRAERNRLARQFGDLLREGAVVVDVSALEDPDEEVPADFRAVLSEPHRVALGLGPFVANMHALGLATVDDAHLGALRRWSELDRLVERRAMTITIRPIAADRPDRCDEIPIGADYGVDE